MFTKDKNSAGSNKKVTN